MYWIYPCGNAKDEAVRNEVMRGETSAIEEVQRLDFALGAVYFLAF